MVGRLIEQKKIRTSTSRGKPTRNRRALLPASGKCNERHIHARVVKPNLAENHRRKHFRFMHIAMTARARKRSGGGRLPSGHASRELLALRDIHRDRSTRALNTALIRLFARGKHAQKRRFARTIWPNEPNAIPRLHRKAHPTKELARTMRFRKICSGQQQGGKA